MRKGRGEKAPKSNKMDWKTRGKEEKRIWGQRKEKNGKEKENGKY